MLEVSAEDRFLTRVMVALDRVPGPTGHGLDQHVRARIGRFVAARGDGVDESRLGCWFAARTVHLSPGAETLGEALIAALGTPPRVIPTTEQIAIVLERAAAQAADAGMW